MSSWLSSVTEFCLNQDVVPYFENTSNYKIKSFSNIKCEKTNSKVNREILKFLKKIGSQNTTSSSSYSISIKTIKVLQTEQKYKLFGSSSTKFSKQFSKEFHKSSPLTVFSHIQGTRKNTFQVPHNKTTFINHKLISKILVHLSSLPSKYSSIDKPLNLQNIKKTQTYDICEPHKTYIKEEYIKENKVPFFHEEKDEHKHHSDHESQEQENDSAPTNKIFKKATQHLLLSSSCSQKPFMNKLISFKANALISKKDKRMTPPKIPLPTIGIFALYYILTKQGIIANQTAYSMYKQEIELTHKEISLTYAQRLKILRENIDKEQSLNRWSALSKLISWIMSFVAVVTACALIVSGVGTIMGAVILAAGLFSLTNSILEITTGWNKIGELLPTKNMTLKKKALGIIKISVGVISLILSSITIIWGGYSQALRALQSITQTISGMLTAGLGICIIGEGISSYKFYYSIADLKETERNLEKLFFKRKDFMEKTDWDLDHLEKLFEDISFALDLQKETDMIDNAFYH